MKKTNEKNNGQEPMTENQKRYIQDLAKRAETKVDVSAIETKEEASETIDFLLASNGVKDTAFERASDEEVDAAFRLATKLVYVGHETHQGEVDDWDKFWNTVKNFTEQYLNHSTAARAAIR